MSRAPKTPQPGDVPRLLERGERIDPDDFRAQYPPLPDSRAEYLRRPDAGGPGAGAVLDGYRLRRQIGRGGMGVVYEAEQIALGRTVALKVLPPAATRHERGLVRFRGEATAVARLSHPRIVAVHGFGVVDGVAWLAMEYVDGIDLAEVVDRLKAARTHGRRFVRISGPDLDQDIAEWAAGRRLIGTLPGDPRIRDGIVLDLRNPFPMLAAMAADVADALRHAHAHGVVHRDVKPSNVILSREGRVKLTDFGLARSTDAGSLTESGDFLGSPAYVSPEQASSRRVRVDERSDLYSLGVTLYELLTLHQPFAGKNVAHVLRNILALEPPPPSRLNPRIPRDLETIVLKAIEKDPARRYQSAEELGDDLRRFLNFEPIAARPLGLLARAGRALRRHRVAVALGAMASLLVSLVVGVTGGWLVDGAPGAHVVANVQEYLRARDAARGGDAEARALLASLGAARTPAERHRLVEDLAAAARRRLELGELTAVRELLLQLDAHVDLQRWEPGERAYAAALVRDAKVHVVRGLRALLQSPSGDAATRRLRLAALESLLSDPDWQVTKNAAVALGELRDPSSLGALLEALARRTDQRGRLALVGGLRQLGHAAAVPLLAEQLEDDDPWIRLAALEALDVLDPPTLPRLAAGLGHDREAWVRHRSENVLARVGESQAP